MHFILKKKKKKYSSPAPSPSHCPVLIAYSMQKWTGKAWKMASRDVTAYLGTHRQMRELMWSKHQISTPISGSLEQKLNIILSCTRLALYSGLTCLSLAVWTLRRRHGTFFHMMGTTDVFLCHTQHMVQCKYRLVAEPEISHMCMIDHNSKTWDEEDEEWNPGST